MSRVQGVGVGVLMSLLQHKAVVVHSVPNGAAVVLNFDDRAHGFGVAPRGDGLLTTDQAQTRQLVATHNLCALVHVVVLDEYAVALRVGLGFRLPRERHCPTKGEVRPAIASPTLS